MAYGYIQRQTLAPGVSTPFMPPMSAASVQIGNGGTTDLLLYTKDGDDAQYLVIAAGWERRLDTHALQVGSVVFWLKCSVSCPVVLEWSF